MRRARYQRGSVTLKERASLPDMWLLRYTEGGIRRAVPIGDVLELPRKADAEKKADELRSSIASLSKTPDLDAAIDRYMLELKHVRPHTVQTKKGIFNHIRAKWGNVPATALVKDLMAVESWLNALTKRNGEPMTKRTKQHIKAELHCLYESIMRWGGMDIQRNPISLLRVKGSPKKARVANILTLEQYSQIREQTQPHISTMVMLCTCLGLRISETLALRWENIDFKHAILKVSHSAVDSKVHDTKTEASAADVDLHPSVLAELQAWKEGKHDTKGWLFESPVTQRPYHRGMLQRRHLYRVGKAIKPPIAKLGWHDFRHTYRSMMRDLELPIEVQQHLMRHTDIRTTSQYGGKRMNLRGHNASVVELMEHKKKA